MENPSLKNFHLNLHNSPTSLDFCNFSLLSETDSDRNGLGLNSNQVNELKAQLEIVNEDRQRLKKENERLRHDKALETTKILAGQKQMESEKISNLMQEINKLRKESEEKEKLLSLMRSLLGNSGESGCKENFESKGKKAGATGHQSRLPGTRVLMKVNRSISPYTKCG